MAGVEKEPEQQDDGLQSPDLADQIIDDDLSIDGIVDIDESSVAANTDHAATRRRLENYLEERRLRKELDDDLF